MSNKGNIICRQAKHLNNLSFKNNSVKIIPSHFTKGWAYLYSEWSSKLCLRTAFYCVCSCRRRFHQKILIQLKYYSLHRYPHLSLRVTDGGNWTDPRRNKLTQLQRSYFVTYSEQQLPTRIVKKAEKSLKQYFTDFSLQNDCVLSRWGCCSESEEICQLWLDTAVSVKYEILADYDCWQQLLFESVSSKLWQQKIWRCDKDHIYRMVKERYSNIWPNQTIGSDQSELTILLCQPINSLLLNENDLAMV